MSKSTLKFALFAAAGSLFASAAWAGPVSLTDAQLDAVAAGGMEIEDAFVCPVISTDAVLNSPKGAEIAGGDYTIGGPVIKVPELATNGDGAGIPNGPHSGPGDTDYTAIWYGEPPQ